MEFNNNHATEILNNLNEERKTTKDFCDFTIKAGGEQFPVHKCVVGSFSEYFKKMFTTKMKESYSNEGSVKEVSGPTMVSIINFIYTSCIILTHDNVYDVLEAAEYLCITRVKMQSTYFIVFMQHGVQNEQDTLAAIRRLLQLQQEIALTAMTDARVVRALSLQ
ncbi:unnamed protein product [Clavelina lepadiformis]|uniref:BTB domain-containing protein n=1 Tax=Clavelina lepadiformis TaxID=159417 RepID=A0ABP0G3Q5_CLALP